MGVYIRRRLNGPFDGPAVTTTPVSDEILVFHLFPRFVRLGNVPHGQTSWVMNCLYP